MFRTVPLSIIRSFSLCTQQWYMSYRFADSLRASYQKSTEKVPSSQMCCSISGQQNQAVWYISAPAWGWTIGCTGWQQFKINCFQLRIQNLDNVLNNRDNVHITYHWGAFVQLLLQWKSNYITYYECVFVALRTQREMRQIFICGLSGSTIFFHVSS